MRPAGAASGALLPDALQTLELVNASTSTPGGCGGSAVAAAAARESAAPDPLEWFQRMIPRCKEYALAARASGRPVVGIMCEYAPRELVLAAGAVPVCLCGGDPDTIPSAETRLPTNLCPLIKSTYGYWVEHGNPFLEMADFVLAETTCDGKKKMFELLGETKPTFLLELPHRDNAPDAREQWVRELARLRDFLATRYRVEVDDARLRAAVRTMNRERGLRRRLADLMKREAPPLTGRQLLDLKSIISGIPADLDQYERALKLLAQADGAAEPGAARGGRPRVLLTGVPLVHGAERVLEIIESSGGLVVCQENCTGLKPILEDVPENASDLLGALADKYFHLPCSVRTPNDGRFQTLRQLTAEFRAECVIELIWQACLTYAIEADRTRRLVEEELKLPYLRIETDYSPSDSARIATRVEALLEMVSDRRGERAPRGTGGNAA